MLTPCYIEILPCAGSRVLRGDRPLASAAPGSQLETACLPGDHINERSCAIRDVLAGDLPGASTETRGLFVHVLPQAVLDRPREGMPGMRCQTDITAPTRCEAVSGARRPRAGR